MLRSQNFDFFFREFDVFSGIPDSFVFLVLKFIPVRPSHTSAIQKDYDVLLNLNELTAHFPFLFSDDPPE